MDDQERFRERITELSDSNYPWLSDFKLPLHRRVLSEFDENDLIYNFDNYPDPFYADNHLSDLGKCLESVALFRSQYFELEEIAVRAALDYELSRRNNSISRQLETNDRAIDRALAMRELSDAISTTAQTQDSDIGALVGQYAASMSQIQGNDLEGIRSQIELVKTKWDNIEAHLSELEKKTPNTGPCTKFF